MISDSKIWLENTQCYIHIERKEKEHTQQEQMLFPVLNPHHRDKNNSNSILQNSAYNGKEHKASKILHQVHI